MKQITHYFAVVIIAVAGVLAANPSLVHTLGTKYPAVSVISTAIIGLAALYHNPKQSPPAGS